MNRESIPSIQQRAEEDYVDLSELFSEHYDQRGDFIDDDLDTTPLSMAYAETLTRTLTGAMRDEQFSAVYRAMHFISLLTSVEGCNRGIAADKLVLLPKGGHEEVGEYIRSIADTYIEEHPTVMGLVDAYMPEVDPSGKEAYLAEMVAGFVGTQIEDGLLVRAAQEWDGQLPEDFS